MKLIEPTVYLIGETRLLAEVEHGESGVPGVYLELPTYLDSINASDYKSNALTDSEELIEAYGKLCYRSWLAGLNKNVKTVREDNKKYIGNILSVNHGSVLEHCWTNWIFKDVSRVLTHELVRHRVGTAFSQESLRYVRLDDLSAWLPSCFKGDSEIEASFIAFYEASESLQKKVSAHYKLDDDGVNFHKKKEVTSAMRRMAPDGLATTIGFSCNFRTLRHLIQLRTAVGAEEEIRLLFNKIAKFSAIRWPAIFQDMRSEFKEGYMEITFGKEVVQ